MKTQDELNKLKHECKTLVEKLSDLSEDELMQVTGGNDDANLYHVAEELGILTDNN